MLTRMMNDILLQIGFILFTVFMFLLMYNIPQKAFTKIRLSLRNPADFQAKRHFIQGAQLLAQARSAKDPSAASSLATSAADEADRAIALDPKDAAAHILKSLTLEFQGFKTSANSVRLKNDNAVAFCLLGECYETEGKTEEARKAYEDAVRVEPRYTAAREALVRLGS
uniref:Uncharacterized protein n=1 Tax=Davidia involucrata TaxID=16924 RepID=A0A5B7BJ10_DAVIN